MRFAVVSEPFWWWKRCWSVSIQRSIFSWDQPRDSAHSLSFDHEPEAIASSATSFWLLPGVTAGVVGFAGIEGFAAFDGLAGVEGLVGVEGFA